MSVSINITMPEVAPKVAAIIDVSKMFRLVDNDLVDNKSYTIFRSDDEIYQVLGKRDDAIHTVVLTYDPTENVTVNGDGEMYTASSYKMTFDDVGFIRITLTLDDEDGEGLDNVCLCIASYGLPYIKHTRGITNIIYEV